MKLGCVLVWGAISFSALAEPIVVPDGHQEYIYEIAYSPDGRQFVTAAGDNTAIVWDTASHQKRHVLEHESAVYSAVFSSDGATVATGDGDGYVSLWDPNDGKSLTRIQRHADAVYAVTFSPDGRFLASAGGSTDGGDAVCRVLSAETLDIVKELAGHERQVYGLAFSPDSKTLASGSSDKTVRLWDLETGESKIWQGHDSDVYRGAFSPDGTHFASPSQDGTIRLWSVETGKIVAAFQPKGKDPFYSVAFSTDGTLLAAVGDDRKAHLLNGSDLTPRSEEELSTYALFAVAFQPKRKLLAIAGEDGKIYLLPALP